MEWGVDFLKCRQVSLLSIPCRKLKWNNKIFEEKNDDVLCRLSKNKWHQIYLRWTLIDFFFYSNRPANYNKGCAAASESLGYLFKPISAFFPQRPFNILGGCPITLPPAAHTHTIWRSLPVRITPSCPTFEKRYSSLSLSTLSFPVLSVSYNTQISHQKFRNSL